MLAFRVRMYRTGFGDCFLITFDPVGTAKHVLIDFGSHMHGDIGTMDLIMDDIEAVSGKQLEVIVATHAHRDHISGFGKFADRFAAFKIGQVWLPWTDNAKDAAAAGLQNKHVALYGQLEKHLLLQQAAGLTSMEMSAAISALANLRGNETATSELARGFGTGADVLYWGAGGSISKVGETTGLSAEILGPPKDISFFTRMDPPANQRYLTAAAQAYNEVHPFLDQEMKPGSPEFTGLQGQPVVPPLDLPALQAAAESPASRLALVLDNIRNNTSLVILFRYGGKSLLFPGDAQWGNWQSWIGNAEAKRILSEVDFLKVAHHGSENATPVEVVAGLKGAGLATVVSTQIQPFPTIPRQPLLAALEQHCTGQIAVRSDFIEVANAPKGPDPTPALPTGFTMGPLWIDYQC
jgi:beta-lactamase superfamily II metal-dependent hydrolase